MATIYHLRITLKEENEAEGVVSNFCNKFEEFMEKALFAYEFKGEDKATTNHHIHGHIQYKPTFKLENIKYYLKTRHAGKYYHMPINKEPEHNELYVIKECRIIRTIGYSEEELQILKHKNQDIEEDKAKDPKQKLIEKLKLKHGNLIKFTMNQLLEEIKFVYINDWDKFPPPQCRALCEYITVKEITEYAKKPRTKKTTLGTR